MLPNPWLDFYLSSTVNSCYRLKHNHTHTHTIRDNKNSNIQSYPDYHTIFKKNKNKVGKM